MGESWMVINDYSTWDNNAFLPAAELSQKSESDLLLTLPPRVVTRILTPHIRSEIFSDWLKITRAELNHYAAYYFAHILWCGVELNQ